MFRRFTEITRLLEAVDAATDVSYLKKKRTANQGLAQAAAAIEAPKVFEHPPGQHESFPHAEPALDATHPHPALKKAALQDAYHDPHQSVSSIAPVGNDTQNTVFRGQMSGGQKFISKPHQDMSIDPERWHGRHEALSRILGHMGASHMAPAGLDTSVHKLDKMPQSSLDPHSDGLPELSPGTHAGNKTLVTANVDGRNLLDTHPDDIANIDADHRLHGLVSHVLMGNNDGHSRNVMVSKDQNGKPHPVLIDQDLALNSGHDRVPYDETEFRDGKEKALNSVFAPGRTLDYSQKMGPVGNNFPHRMKKTLEWLAAGGHKHPEHGIKELHPDDAMELQDNANTLLKHGLEGTLAKRDLAKPSQRDIARTKPKV